ncbi:hypothetical protein [Leeuwenhoekiella nanhaiensis]|uniref:Uncharacterized protein n=1 Tax=Leeuwenhoekiella nanhaiensis TaxID=1655491 RepID=A0A2G1VXI2_9FLAO|nr:hypothetical protein [Leeuwenhoekiella nanhaiensis]PHQ31320.1 hypothetical protein CJ305_03655 [Leeuwenhoekiella nanhaiensis]
MNSTHHCDLCDHQEKSLSQGSICTLTGHKPAFSNTCSKISLGTEFEDKLKDVNIRYAKLQKDRAITYAYFIVFLLIGIVVIAGGFLFGKYIYDKGFLSTVPLIIMAVGLAPLGLAIGTLNKHLENRKAAKLKKDRVDAVLEKYRITYDITVQFGASYHGKQEVYVDLQTSNIPNIHR